MNSRAIAKLCTLPVLVLILLGCSASMKTGDGQEEKKVVFYNVENLFDTIDNPEKLDDVYLPDSVKLWSTQRYNAKLDSLAKIIRFAAGGQAPDLLGLCEVENRQVVEDLAKRVGSDKFGISHFQSPDLRGIDCALVYHSGKGGFKVESEERIRYDFPDEPLTWVREYQDSLPYTSRDILYVKGSFENSKESLHIFVNHWPSRHGGLEKSQPRRLRAASVLRAKVDSIEAAEPEALILIMGDLNDEPDNESVSRVLGAGMGGFQDGTLAEFSSGLTNLMGLIHQEEGKGSYNYRGNWNTLDHLIVSESLLDQDGDIMIYNAGVARADWMMFDHPKFGLTPSRTFGGPNYYAGYSDHLPVVANIAIRK